MLQRRKRLLYRASHRGMREMDIILSNFMRTLTLDAHTCTLCEALLLMDDADLYLWITGRTPPLPCDTIILTHLLGDLTLTLRQFNRHD